MIKEKNSLSAILLVTGCCIGAGMIGLPVVSAAAGFIPSSLAMVLCYFFSTGTGLLILEATLWFEERVNLISMAGFALGKTGRYMTWFLFLFLFYCVFVAYVDGGGQLFSQAISFLISRPINREIGIICCVASVGLISYCGVRAVSVVSRLFLVGMGFSYCALLSFGLPHVEGDRLLYTNWMAALSTLPILLICFGYQNLLPTLVYYAKKNIAVIRIAIFAGNLIPFVIYFLWNFVILGILPEPNSPDFAAATNQSNMVTDLLEKASQSTSIILLANVFAFFAVLTPFTANTVAFVDFLKDGFKIAKESRFDILIYGLVLAPPMIVSFIYPDAFLKALAIAGGFADVLLFGILPVCIVWIGRYIKKTQGPYTAPGGKLFLLTILFLSIGFLLIGK